MKGTEATPSAGAEPAGTGPAPSGPTDGPGGAASLDIVGRTRSAFGTVAGFIALLVLLGQTAWLAVLLNRGYWTQDDYVLLNRVATEPFTLDYLGSPFAGEFSPVGHLLARGLGALDLFQWEVAIILMLVLQASVGYLLWLLLTEILGHRWVRLPLLTLAAFSPLALPSSLWFSLAVLHLPATAAFLGGTLVLLVHLRAGSPGGRVLALGLFVLALFTSDQTLLHPLAAFAVVAVCLPAAGLPAATRVARAFMAAPRFWLLLVLVAAARLALGRAARQNLVDWAALTQETAETLEVYLRQLLVGLVGGPWDGVAEGTVVSTTENSPLVVAVLLCLVAAWVLVRRGTAATRAALVALVLYLLAGGVQYTVVGTYVSVSGHQRFLADAVAVSVVLVAAAISTTGLPPALARRVQKAPGTVAVAVSLVVLLSCTLTLRVLVPAVDNIEGRAYVENLREALREEPRTVLVDGPVPEQVMSSLLGDEARVSTVAAHVPESPVFDLPSEVLRMVDDDGDLEPVVVQSTVGAVGALEGPCPHPVQYVPTTIVLEGSVPAGRNVLTFGYFTSLDTFASVEIGDDLVNVPVRSGLQQVQVPFQGAAGSLQVGLESDEGTVCLTDIAAGTVTAPSPSPSP